MRLDVSGLVRHSYWFDSRIEQLKVPQSAALDPIVYLSRAGIVCCGLHLIEGYVLLSGITSNWQSAPRDPPRLLRAD